MRWLGFSSNAIDRRRFFKLMEPSREKLLKQGIPAEKVEGFFDMIFHGTNSRIFNAPIDLFIEDHIYNTFPELRPQQFLSLQYLENLAIQAVTDPNIISLTPAVIISKIKVYNTITARQFDDLYGTETEKNYPLSKQEKEHVEAFWIEFSEYRKDKEHGEEYELIENWGKDLELDQYFKLQEEVLEKNGGSIQGGKKEILEDPESE